MDTDTGAPIVDGAEPDAGARGDLSAAYGWRQTAVVLLVWFGPLLATLAVGAVWLLFDRSGLRRAVSGDGGDLWTAVVAVAGTLLVAWYVSARNRRHGLTWAELGVRKVPFWRAFRYAVGFFVLVLLTVVAIASAAVALHVPEPSSAQTSSTRGALGWVWVIVGAVVIGPVGEELIYRGMLFGFLRSRHRFVVSALLSSAVFMLTHVEPVAFVTALPLGIYLCLMYERLGSIVPGMVVHAVWNLMVSTLK